MYLSVENFIQRSGKMEQVQQSASQHEEALADQDDHMSVETENDDGKTTTNTSVAAAAAAEEEEESSITAVAIAELPSCCNQMNEKFVPVYKIHGGVISSTGSSGLDGTSTIGKAHRVTNLLIEHCKLDNRSTYVDLGSSVGTHVIHVVLQTGATAIGIENNDNRFKQSIMSLTKLGIMVKPNPLTLNLPNPNSSHLLLSVSP